MRTEERGLYAVDRAARPMTAHFPNRLARLQQIGELTNTSTSYTQPAVSADSIR